MYTVVVTIIIVLRWVSFCRPFVPATRAIFIYRLNLFSSQLVLFPFSISSNDWRTNGVGVLFCSLLDLATQRSHGQRASPCPGRGSEKFLREVFAFDAFDEKMPGMPLGCTTAATATSEYQSAVVRKSQSPKTTRKMVSSV